MDNNRGSKNMPLPLIIGAAVALAGVGVKKAIDASEDREKADQINTTAKEIFDEALSKLNTARAETNNSIEELGRLKYEIYEQSIIPFVEKFRTVKNVNFKDNFGTDKGLKLTKEELQSFCQSVLAIEEVLSGGVAALGGGGLAGLAAYGAVGILGTASTGTALGTLSGAALTNATLAWFGGGSLAAGGLGIAGGTMVLGGIVAGPALAVGGLMLASAAEAAKHEAYANLGMAQLNAEQFKTAIVAVDGVKKAFEEIQVVLKALQDRFKPMLADFESLVKSSSDYASWSEADQKGVYMTATLATTIKNLLEVKLLEEQGVLSAGAKAIAKLRPNQISSGEIKIDEAIEAERAFAEKEANSVKVVIKSLADIVREKGAKLNGSSSMYSGHSLNDAKVQKKINNAINAYASKAKGELLVLVDATVFGKCDKGFYITTEEICANVVEDEIFYILLSDVKRVRQYDDDTEIQINTKYLPYTFSTLNPYMKVLVDCLKEYIEQSK